MSKLHDLYREQGQSPWLDNLRRDRIEGGGLRRWIEHGVRGVTSNPTLFQKAIEGTRAYDQQCRELIEGGASPLEAYWEMVVKDVADALAMLLPLHEKSQGGDGLVSLDLAPSLARDAQASITSARRFHQLIDAPSLMVKIPATQEGILAIRQLVSEGKSINATLIFSLERHAEVIEAYLSGLETYAGDLSRVHSVASFFVSRLDTEVDKRLEAIGLREALALRGQVAVAQAKLAYRLFQARFSGPRWLALKRRGARMQRPLWAEASTKNLQYPDTLYVDNLIGPDTVSTLPEATLRAFEDHGVVRRTVDEDMGAALAVMERLSELGIDVEDVSRVLEEEGVAKLEQSFDELLRSLGAKATALRGAGAGAPI